MSADIPLVDHHCHGVVMADLQQPELELLLTESAHPAPAGTSHFDSPLGLAVRRWCAPLLDLEPGCPTEVYVERRIALGAHAVNQHLLTAAGLDAVLVETGYTPTDVTSPAELGALAGARSYEVVRIERVAEEVLARIETPQEYAGAYEATLRDRASGAVGLKSIVAYRGGFALAPSPSAGEVTAAAARTLTGEGDAIHLDDPVLLRFGLDIAGEIAAELGLPVQFHAGYGDDDLQLDQANPSLLTPVIRQYGQRGTAVVLLHCYPYHREAGYLAAVFPHVSFDVGLALPYLGASSRRVLAEALELAPFTKQLYSSDAFGLAEIYLVASRLFHRGVREVLDGWVTAGDCTAGDADRIYEGIAAGNARRIYPLASRT